MEKRRNCSSFPQYFRYISNVKSPITYIFVKCGCSNYFFLNSENLICRGTDISKCFRESLGIRDNESRLYQYCPVPALLCSLRVFHNIKRNPPGTNPVTHRIRIVTTHNTEKYYQKLHRLSGEEPYALYKKITPNVYIFPQPYTHTSFLKKGLVPERSVAFRYCLLKNKRFLHRFKTMC